jgi:hypothetical protein
VKYIREAHGFREKNHQLDWRRCMLASFAKDPPAKAAAKARQQGSAMKAQREESCP